MYSILGVHLEQMICKISKTHFKRRTFHKQKLILIEIKTVGRDYAISLAPRPTLESADSLFCVAIK